MRYCLAFDTDRSEEASKETTFKEGADQAVAFLNSVPVPGRDFGSLVAFDHGMTLVAEGDDPTKLIASLSNVRPGKGTCFRIYLPISEEQVAAEVTSAPKRVSTGAETILLVEDQDAVRDLVRTVLERQGYTVLAAASPSHALSILDKPTLPIDLLLTDLVMPEMSGHLLAAEAAAKRPGIRVLYMSGYSEEEVTEQTAGKERIAFLEKPFTVSKVTETVRRVLDQSEV